MSLTFPIDAKLKDGSPVQLVLADERDVEPLRAALPGDCRRGERRTRMTGSRIRMISWTIGFAARVTVAAYVPDRAGAAGMAGAFYLKPNWPGRAGHVANAGFIVAPDWREQRLGLAVGDHDAGLRQATRLPWRDLQSCVF